MKNLLGSSVLGKVYDVWQNSVAFAFLRLIYRAFSRAFYHSAVVRFFVKDSRVEAVYAQSVTAKLLRAIFDFIARGLTLLCDGIKRAAEGGVAARFWNKYVKNAWFLNFETLLGGFLLLMFVVPHDSWSNTYALMGVLGLFVLYFFMVGARTRKLLHLHELGLPFLLFALAAVLGIVFSLDRADSFRVFLFYLTAFLFVYLIVADVSTTQRLDKLLGFLFAAVVFTAFYAFYQRLTGVQVNASQTDIFLNPGVPGRVFASFGNPNNYSEFLVMMTPLAAVFAVRRKNPLLRALLCCAMVFPVIALVMTYSRSGWISILAACLVFVYFAQKKLLPALLLLGAAAVPFLPNSVMVRIASLFSGGDTSSVFRLYIWQGAIGIVRDNWLTGIGLGPAAFAMVYPAYANVKALVGVPHSHMVYMELIIEFGILGFLSFMWYMFRLWKDSAVAAVHRAAGDRTLRLTLIAALASLVGISLNFAVEYVWFYPRTMFTYFILAGIAAAAVRISKAPKTDASAQPGQADRAPHEEQ